VKSKFLFSVETNPKGSKTISLFGKNSLTLNKSDAKFMARLLTHSKQDQLSDSSASFSDLQVKTKRGKPVLIPVA
jgi:hypothetical protein